MNRPGRKLWIGTGIGIAVLATFSMLALAHDEPEIHIDQKGKVQIVVVDDDGNRHEEVYEFGGNEPRAFLGVQLDGTHDGGAVVENVVEDSAAERAGLREGDVIVGLDGEEIDGPWDLTTRILGFEPGDRVDVDVRRDGQRQTISVELGEREGGAFSFGFDMEAFGERMGELGERLGQLDLDINFDSLGESMERLHERLEKLDGLDFHFDFDHLGFDHLGFGHQGFARPRLGVQLVEATPELREHLGSSPDEGVLVSRLIPGMPAEDAGVQVGDLIVAVNGEAVADAGDLRRALRGSQGRTLDLDVIRDGRRSTLSVFIPEAEDHDNPAGLHPTGGPSRKA